jgi:hypothetical protein
MVTLVYFTAVLKYYDSSCEGCALSIAPRVHHSSFMQRNSTPGEIESYSYIQTQKQIQ